MAASVKFGIFADVHVDLVQSAATSFGDAIYSGSPIGHRIAGYHTTSMPLFNDNANAASVDFSISVGDLVNPGRSDAERITHFAEYVEHVDGTKSTQNADMYYAIGHWDMGGPANNAVDWNNFFDNTNGIGSIIPTAAAAPANPWWPDSPAGISAQSPCAYTFNKNNIMMIVLCLPSTTVNMDSSGKFGAGSVAKTQNEWFQDRLNEAEAASEPVIVFTHQTLKVDYWQGTAPAGAATAITAMENQTIKPIVFQGHIHSYRLIEESNGIVYINLTGDLWGENETDTDRFSHAIVTITGPNYTDVNGQRCSIDLVGYGNQRSEDMTMALVGHWKLNEKTGTSGASSILDCSGNTYHGTPATSIVAVSAPVAGGITFDGTNDYINGSDTIINDYPLSISCWVRVAGNLGADACVVSLGNTTAARHLCLLIIANGAGVKWDVKTTMLATYASGAFVCNGVWRHIVGVSAASDNHKVYIDGKLGSGASTTSKAFSTMDQWAIGRKEDNSPDSLFTGDISDVRVYSGALTANDVANLFLQGANRIRRSRYSGIKTASKSRFPRNRYKGD